MLYNFETIVGPLLAWYEKNRRSLPWREDPTPYHVWVSEIMLQQTRVEAVKGYYARFLQALPEVRDLAEAPEEQILKLWEGLGYYNRVRNMQLAARQVMEEWGGIIPDDFEKLLGLRGVGRYTAGAIASIAYNRPVPAVDGNVLRVMNRLSACYDDISKESAKRAMENKLLPVMPKEAGAFNQAVMDLGAMVCIPNGAPLCKQCPLAEYCLAEKNNIQMELPVKPKKKARKIEKKTILLLECHGKYALRKRSDKGLLAGMWEFPSVEGKAKKGEISKLLSEEKNQAKIEELGPGKHIFSHIEWDMVGYRISLEQEIEREDYVWIDVEEIRKSYAIPSAFANYMKWLV